MQRLTSLAELGGLRGPLHLALGVFDGVHLGHRAVVDAAVEGARVSGGLVGVVTFEPHPIQVLAPAKAPRRILASLEHKERLLAALGVSFVVVIPFTAEFAALEARDFADELFGSAADLKQVTVGEDWQFGRGRGGTVSLLREWGETRGVAVDAVAPIMAEGERISSTRIRQAIRDGNLSGAEAMLGREFSVFGIVAHGRQLGAKIGTPTANIEVGDEQLPPDGVYVVKAEVGGVLRKGVGNLGMRPTVGAERRLLEVHLFDFDGDLYGKEMEVWFGPYLRGEEKFADVEALKVQIGKDLARAREIG
jgi:riboflavin kinase/FMN adenylyltransferase